MYKRNRILIIVSLCALALVASACGTASGDLTGQVTAGDDLATAGRLTPTVEELAARELSVPADDTTLHVRVAGGLEEENVLIAVNGGPGMASDYMVSLEGLAGGGADPGHLRSAGNGPLDQAIGGYPQL
jgi:predicted small secreted protein